MKGDFTRDTFDQRKQFSRVLMQQGRVTLDADTNEQTAILLHYLRALARDLIGPYAAPADNVGFLLGVDDVGRLRIGTGRYYVDGLLVENLDDACFYDAQPYYKPPPDDPLLKELHDSSGKVFWLYLDVWERHITAVEDGTIRESALGGPDTCTRAQVVWQVKALDAPDATIGDDGTLEGATCDAGLDGLLPMSTGRLAARLDPGVRDDNPCVTSPDSKFRGAENHLYRVEVHDGSESGDPTFKWSRENGSVVAAWLSTSGHDLRVAQVRGFSAGSWVELSNDAIDAAGAPGLLVKLSKVEGDILSVDPSSIPSGESVAHDPSAGHPKVRRWDQRRTDRSPLVNGAVPLVEAEVGEPKWLTLENGIQVQFTGDGVYRTGDYWLIPARWSTGQIEWPSTVSNGGNVAPEPRPPHGVEHHYAPLGFIAWEDQALRQSSCSCQFEPLSSCANQADRGVRGGTDVAPGIAPSRRPRRRKRPVD
jgi:hypothetical protein